MTSNIARCRIPRSEFRFLHVDVGRRIVCKIFFLLNAFILDLRTLVSKMLKHLQILA